MSDIRHIMWKEWKIFLRVDGGGVALVARLVLLGVIAYLIVSVMGPGFGSDPSTIGLVSFVACVAVLPSVADSFAGEREQRTLESLLATPISDGALLLGKLAAVVSYGWATGMGLMALGIPLTALRFGGQGFGVDPVTVIEATTVSLLAATAVTALGIAASLRASTVKDANQILGGIFILLGSLPFLVAEVLPEGVLDQVRASMPGIPARLNIPTVAAQLVLIDVVLVALAAALYRRSRLARII